MGALALAFMYPLLRDTYGVVGENAQLLRPTSQRWVGFAKLVTQELTGPAATNPATAARIDWMTTSLGIGALIGVLLTLLEQNPRWRPYVPSPTGMGIAMLIPVNAVTMIFLGAAADSIWAKASPESHERYSIPIASGLIASVCW